MNQVILGAIGAGRIGKLHAENILRMPEACLKIVADPFIDENWAQGWGLSTTLDPEAVFSDDEIEAVLILSPSPLHAEQIIAAARAGKHIFCEKPIALNPDHIKQAQKVVAEVIRYPIGHFDIYLGKHFEPAVSDHLEFFSSHL